MRRYRRTMRLVALVVLCLFAQSLLLPGIVRAQAPCQYDKLKPSIENARYNFKITNYQCAEMELKDLLAVDTLDYETKADAHVLLAAVYYAKVRNQDEKRDRVMEQFVAAFRAYEDWRGELDIKSSEFEAMMEEAKIRVEQQRQEAAAAAEEQDQTEPEPVPVLVEAEKGKKPWYKKWYIWGIGAAVVGAAVAVAAGGGGDDGGDGGGDDLPGFPPPPAKR